jgi:hypothetical protein
VSRRGREWKRKQTARFRFSLEGTHHGDRGADGHDVLLLAQHLLRLFAHHPHLILRDDLSPQQLLDLSFMGEEGRVRSVRGFGSRLDDCLSV